MKITPSQAERLDVLIEEAAEVIMAACKIQRFGFESYHPDHVEGPNNLENLHNEIGNFVSMLDLMIEAGDIEEVKIYEAAELKKQTRDKYMRYQ